MSNIKINILYSFPKGSWGGGNQFLRALREYFKNKGCYEDNPKKANCILFNSHHDIEKVLHLKKTYQNKIFIHRIDGPLYLIRDDNLKADKRIYDFNHLIADATILQSEWSRRYNYSLGLKRNRFEAVIMNAADNSIFYPKNETNYEEQDSDKWKIVASSWSSNINKGFELYKFLDENLDFNKYSMMFIGNSPFSFKNIKHVKPVDSAELARLLRENHIYITGSKNDPCSNSLIEALSCGLPSIALNDGGHPEIVRESGELFNTFEECLVKIEQVKDNYNLCRKNINAPKIEEISQKYLDFLELVYNAIELKKYQPKKLRYFDYIKLQLKSTPKLMSNVKNVINSELNRKFS